MYGLTPEALTQPTTCSELFHLATILFKSARESKSTALDLSMTVQTLSRLLLSHKPHEVRFLAFVHSSEQLIDTSSQDIIQPGAVDLAVHGLANLLHCMLCDTDDMASSEVLASE